MALSEIFLNAGEEPIRLAVADQAWYRRIRAVFLGDALGRRTHGTFRVTADRINRAGEAIPSHWVHLDGEGDYVAALAPDGRRAWVGVHPRVPLRGLWGALRRLQVRRLVARGGAVLHAACVVREGWAYLFFGRSGAGKTTVCRFSRDAQAVADDLIAVRTRRDRMVVWGLPARRRPPYIMAIGPFPIRAAFILKKARVMRLVRLAPARAAAAMLGVPRDLLRPEPAATALAVVSDLARTAPCYDLYFKKNALFWRNILNELDE